MSQIHEYKVTMTCDGCRSAVERVLGKLQGNGVEKVVISLENQTVTVTTTMTADEILNIIKKTGKDVQFLKTI